MYRSLAIIVVLSLLALPAAAKERTWTSTDGRTMKAEFVREVDGVATFLKDGKLLSIPLEKLSEKDQQIIRDLAMGRPVPDEEPPASDAAASTPPAASDGGTGAAATTESRPPARITIETRTWTNDRGIKMQARFVRMSGTSVVLNRAGKVVNVEFYSLSDDDQQYLRDLLTQQGKAELIPPPRDATASVPAPGSTPGPGGPVASGTPSRPFPPAGSGPGVGSAVGSPPGAGAPGGIGPGGIGPGALPPGGPTGGFPTGGFPGSGPSPPQPPMAGGPSDSGLPVSGSPPGLSSPPGTSGGGLSSGGMPQGIGSSPGIDTTPPFGGPNVPTSYGEPGYPGGASTPISSGPSFRQVLHCTGCQREISQEQSRLDRCPYCNTRWLYKEDGTGRREMTSSGVRNAVIGVGVAVVVVVFGGVVGFIGIIVAVVRAVSRPARANYRRY